MRWIIFEVGCRVQLPWEINRASFRHIAVACAVRRKERNALIAVCALN